MNTRKLIITALTIAALSAPIASGCGSSSSSDSTGSTAASTGSTTASSKPSTEFAASAYAGFGEEADDSEREAASEILEENLHARAEKKWDEQCASLSSRQEKEIIERAEFITGKKGEACGKGLELEAEPIAASVLAYPMTGPIAVLRVEGNKGYAFFHGIKGKDYSIPMVKENGKWTVDSLTTEEVAKG